MHLAYPHSIQYPHPISDAYLKELQDNANEPPKKKEDNLRTTVVDPEIATEPARVEGATSTETSAAAQEDTPDVPVRFAEKKRLHWKGKTCECVRRQQLGLISNVHTRSGTTHHGWQLGKHTSLACHY